MFNTALDQVTAKRMYLNAFFIEIFYYLLKGICYSFVCNIESAWGTAYFYVNVDFKNLGLARKFVGYYPFLNFCNYLFKLTTFNEHKWYYDTYAMKRSLRFGTGRPLPL
ncbi:hypothetical protein NQ317_012255 [Molorchus minor]|uniref:Uncharacterized protein n=1 Tax=Molorchus minor TaxID=1323400 RepID=A0ABQ9K097_9CUCU|nr:hypothetical protein NQ317_012255 [Molorchus minor]